MKKVLYVVLPLVLLFSFNSCDWFNVTFLGKPSKAELELARLKKERAQQDSLNLLAAEREKEAKLLETQQTVAAAPANTLANDRYHVVVGCFKISDNVDRMETLLRNNGYKAQRIYLKNGFICISAFSSNELEMALEELYKIMKQEFVSDDAWVYDSKTELHK